MKRSEMTLVVLVFAVGLAVNFGAGIATGIGKPMESDAHYFLQIARCVASGGGYKLPNGFWPQAPTMSRLPGWPLAVALALKIFRGVSPDAVMRILSLLINAATAAAFAALTLVLFRRKSAATLAGLAYAAHPAGLYYAVRGSSEILFLFLAAVGTLFLLRGGRWSLAGFLALGCACLERANFVLWLPFFVVAAGIFGWRVRGLWRRETLALAVAGAVLFAAPTSVWLARNYRACGHFPVLSTLRGQTFYGGNNARVADTLEYWGCWVFPNDIPGETPMVELARTMSEYEVDAHYFRKGVRHVREHGFVMPRLWLGKFIRAYVPVPWKPTWGTYAISAFRWLIYAGAVVGLAAGWRRARLLYRLILLAMAGTSLVAVLMFWGCARFAFALEPFWFPFFGVGVVTLWDGLRRNGRDAAPAR